MSWKWRGQLIVWEAYVSLHEESFLLNAHFFAGQSTSPYVGVDSTHNSLSSDWIKSLFTVAGL